MPSFFLDGTPGGVPSFGCGINNIPHLELLLWIPRAINIAPYVELHLSEQKAVQLVSAL
jgi:hypothetical protein